MYFDTATQTRRRDWLINVAKRFGLKARPEGLSFRPRQLDNRRALTKRITVMMMMMMMMRMMTTMMMMMTMVIILFNNNTDNKDS